VIAVTSEGLGVDETKANGRKPRSQFFAIPILAQPTYDQPSRKTIEHYDRRYTSRQEQEHLKGLSEAPIRSRECAPPLPHVLDPHLLRTPIAFQVSCVQGALLPFRRSVVSVGREKALLQRRCSNIIVS